MKTLGAILAALLLAACQVDHKGNVEPTAETQTATAEAAKETRDAAGKVKEGAQELGQEIKQGAEQVKESEAAKRVAAGAREAGQPLEPSHVDVEKTGRAQHDHLVVNLQQAAVRTVAGEHPPGDVGGLMQVVHRRGDRPAGPQHLQEHVAVQPLIRCQRQEFYQRTGLAQAPLADRYGRPVPVHAEAAEQADAHAAQRNDRSPGLAAATV